MKDYLFLIACLAPVIAASLLVVAVVANWHWFLIAVLGGFTGGSLVTPSFFRGLADIYRHGIHNDR